MKTLCLTGHRPNKLWGYDIHTKPYYDLGRIIRIFILEHDYTHFISGMALGADTVFALVVLKLKKDFPERGYKLECAIPCKDHSSKWQQASKDEWQSIVDQADKITYVSDKEYSNSCMQDRNEYMVKESDSIIAVWDGSAGGTKNCIKYAEKQGKDVFNFLVKE